MDGACQLFGAGVYPPRAIEIGPSDCIIAVDGGLLEVERRGLRPDWIVGDFDSLGFVPEGDNVLKLPREKDETDMRFALRRGLDLGYRLFEIHGGTGDRLDHTLANIQCLVMLAEAGVRGHLHHADNIITAFSESGLSFEEGYQGYFSLFAASDEVRGVNIRGMKYELHDAVLTNANPVGISNEFLACPSRVWCTRGTLIALYPCGVRSLPFRVECA